MTAMPHPSRVFTIDPLTDSRWARLVERHRLGGIFHTVGWLRALQETYGYNPLVVTTAEPNVELTSGMVLCEVSSWITGRRLVSLPFSDHCAPLVDSSGELEELLAHLSRWRCEGHYRYAEFRPLMDTQWFLAKAARIDVFSIHTLPLDKGPDELLRAMHKNCIQRKIRRAERESLRHEAGRDKRLIEQFYALLLRTSRRHGQPPQPLRWFENLSKHLGDQLSVHLAFRDDLPVAAMITLQYKQTVTYKYGASDERYKNLGGTPFLFWKVIQEAVSSGMKCLDLGRTAFESTGLITFKSRLGAREQSLRYGVPGEFCTSLHDQRNWYERSLAWREERSIRRSRS